MASALVRSASWLKKAAAICERPALCTQAKITLSIVTPGCNPVGWVESHRERLPLPDVVDFLLQGERIERRERKTEKHADASVKHSKSLTKSMLDLFRRSLDGNGVSVCTSQRKSAAFVRSLTPEFLLATWFGFLPLLSDS
jgi:hypothetical protein